MQKRQHFRGHRFLHAGAAHIVNGIPFSHP
jgi:hypothetical protein